MRALVAAFVALLVLSAVAIAALPRLIEGETVRTLLLNRLEASTGRRLLVDGAAELNLLPRPWLSIAEVSLLPRWSGDSSLIAARLDLELELLPLLRGEISSRRLRLVRPVVDLGPPGELVTTLAALLDREDGGGLAALTVIDGTLSLADADGAGARTARQVDLELRLGGNDAHGRINGQALLGDRPVRLSGQAVSSDGGRSLELQLEGSVGGEVRLIEFGYAGRLVGRGAEPGARGQVRLATIDGLGLQEWLQRLDLVGTTLPAAAGALALEARLTAAPAFWLLEDLVLASPSGRVTGTVSLTGGDDRFVDAELAIERWTMATPPADALRGWLDWRPPTDLAGRIAVEAQGLSIGALPLRDVRLAARLGAGSLRIDRLRALLPEDAELLVAVALEDAGAEPAWRGRASLIAPSLRATLARLGERVAWLAADRPLATSVELDLLASPAEVELSAIELRVDGTVARGAVRIADLAAPSIAITGSVDRLDLGVLAAEARGPVDNAKALLAALLDPDRSRVGWPPITLDLALDRVLLPGTVAEGGQLRARLDGAGLAIERLVVDTLAGARVDLTGALSGGGRGELSGEIVAAAPMRLLRLAGLELPAGMALPSPLALAGSARFDGATAMLDLRIDSPQLGGELVGAAALDRTSPMDLAIRAQGAALDELVAALALAPDTAALDATPFAIDLRLRRAVAAGELVVEGEARLLDARWSGRIALPRDQPAIGRIAADGLRVEPLLDLYRLLELPAGLPAGPLRAWPGNWPRQRAAQALDPELMVDVELVADLAPASDGGRATGHLRIAGGRLELDRLDLPLAGGRLTGRLALELGDDDDPEVEISLDLVGATAERLLPALRAGERLDGVVELQLDARMAGRSLQELIASASGRGRIHLRNGHLVDPGLGGTGPGAAERRDYGLLGGAFIIERGIATTEQFDLMLADGRVDVDARFDLVAWILEARLTPGDAAREAGLSSVSLIGAPDRLQRLTLEPLSLSP